MKPTLLDLAQALAAGRTSSVALAEEALARLEDPAGEGARAFVRVDREAVLAQARASDLLRERGIAPSPLAGLPVSVKDLFDVQGEVTTAGSRALRDAPAASRDAPAVARLRAAGAVLVGRTNMTEFAFSGLGLNPHYGTPGNPLDRSRIPGGSSSGAAVSVADGMAAAALGSDTGGSLRIPAAFCGLVGFKPTQARVPREGAVPLSWTLDCVGPIARTVACCAILDAVLSGDELRPPAPATADGLRLAVPRSYLLEALDPAVARAFTEALDRLSRAGAHIVDVALPGLDRIPSLNAKGGLIAPEALAWHRELMQARGAEYDPRVRARILRGREQDASEYAELLRMRAALCAEIDAASAAFDALVTPTVAVPPPRIADLAEDGEFTRTNVLVLRNTSAWNFLDLPAISVPCAGAELPVGFMLAGHRGRDRRLLEIAGAVAVVVGNR